MKSGHISLRQLEDIIDSAADGDGYTAKLLSDRESIARKIHEEELELQLASERQETSQVAAEMADLLYHMLVLARYHGVRLVDIERIFWKEHKKKRAASIDISRFDQFVDQSQQLSLKTISASLSIPISPRVDVLALSHVFAKTRLPDREEAAIFSRVARDLVSNLTERKQKVKRGVPTGLDPEYRQRRGAGLLLPVVVMLNSIVVPVCLNLLASYIKEWLDNTKSSGSRPEIEVVFAIRPSGKKKETWYRLTGQPESVYKEMQRLRGKTG